MKDINEALNAVLKEQNKLRLDVYKKVFFASLLVLAMLAIGYMLNLSSKTASLTAILMSPILITSIVFMLLIEYK